MMKYQRKIYRIVDAETLEVVFIGFTEEVIKETLYQTLYRIRCCHKEVKDTDCYLLEVAEPLTDSERLRFFMEYRPKFNFRDRERYLSEAFLKSDKYANLKKFTDEERKNWKLFRSIGDALTSIMHTEMLKKYLKQADCSCKNPETEITMLINGIHDGTIQNPALYKNSEEQFEKELLTEMWKEFLVQTKANFHFRTVKFILNDGTEFVPDFYVTLDNFDNLFNIQNYIFQIEETDAAYQLFQEFHIPVLFLKDFPETKEFTACSEKNRLEMYRKLSEIVFYSVDGGKHTLVFDGESLDITVPFNAPDSEEFLKEESMRTEEEKLTLFKEDYMAYQAYHLINMMKPMLRKELRNEK